MPGRWRTQMMSLQSLRIETCWRPHEGQEAGDFTCAVDLRDGRAVVIIGDVAGYGARAATRARELIRHFEDVVHDDPAPRRILERLDRFVEETEPDSLATCACLLVDSSSREVQVANAGHPPILFADAAGARLADAPPGPPLGLVRRREMAGYQLSIDAGLVLYTDGLIERRGVELDSSLLLLLEMGQTLAEGRTWAAQLARRVAERLGQPPDDATIVVVRFTAHPLAIGEAARPIVPVRLLVFVDGRDAKSQRTREIVRELVERCPPSYDVEIQFVDIANDPDLIEREGVIAIPTVIRSHPLPGVRHIGIPRSAGALAQALDLALEDNFDLVWEDNS